MTALAVCAAVLAAIASLARPRAHTKAVAALSIIAMTLFLSLARRDQARELEDYAEDEMATACDFFSRSVLGVAYDWEEYPPHADPRDPPQLVHDLTIVQTLRCVPAWEALACLSPLSGPVDVAMVPALERLALRVVGRGSCFVESEVQP